MIGTSVSHYKVLEKIGEGGMGEVYLADDAKLHRKVALKFLPEELTRDDERKQRFVREARSAAGVQHPHIAAIYDVDEAGGRTFIAMEYVPGESLRELIRSKKLGYRRSLELGIQIAEGLAKAHEKGVVHRDVKPENVLVSEDGYAKIIDFGLAKLVEPVASGEMPADLEEAETLLKTREGMVMGTLAYMSPEQALGEPLDRRTDIFSLGVVLYEMLSGVAPFRRKSAAGTLGALLKESPPTLTISDSATPAELQRILERALAKERSERYPSMKDLAGDLKGLRDRGMTSAPTAAVVAAPGRRTWLWAGASVAVAVLLAATFYLGSRRAPSPGIGTSGRPAVAVMSFESMSGDQQIRWLSRGLPNMLVTDLAQTPGLDVVPTQRVQELLKQVGKEDAEALDQSVISEVARRAGAGAVVVGSIFKSGDEIRIDVQLEDVGSGRILSARSVRGKDVFPLVDELTGRIRASLRVGDRAAGRAIAEVTTPSLEAYQHYTEGLEAFRNFRYLDARRSFEKAIEIDPSFASAYFQLSQVTFALFEPALHEQSLEKALELRDRLPEREKLHLQAWSAQLRGNLDESVKMYEELVSRYPDEEDIYAELSSIYGGNLHDDARRLATLERGVRAVPSSGQLHDALGYALLGSHRYAEAIRELQTYASLSPREPNPYDSLGDAYLTTGDPDEASEQFTRALEIDPSFYGAHAGLAWADGMRGRFDEALKEVESMRGVLEQQGASSSLEALALFNYRAFLLSRVGRYREAESNLREVIDGGKREEGRLPALSGARMRAVVAIERRDYARAIEQTSRAQQAIPQISRERPRNDFEVVFHLLAGVAQARSGHLEAARAQLEAQSRLHLDSVAFRWFHGALAGEIALAEGDLAAAESAFVSGEPEFKMPGGRWSLANNTLPFRDGLARVKEARGDLAGAVAIYRSLNTPGVDNKWTSVLEPRYVLETARLRDRMGDKEGARADYRRFLDLWRNADEGLPEVREARAYLAP
jgi:tetratricopeptide (TPR) repeat protein/TolB-like protein/predicted Ser/Thr protein kinase